MAKLSAARRKKMPKSQFALPSKRKYPIHDISHARNALTRASQKGTAGSYSTIRAAVLKKYPSLKKTGKSRKRRK